MQLPQLMMSLSTQSCRHQLLIVSYHCFHHCCLAYFLLQFGLIL